MQADARYQRHPHGCPAPGTPGHTTRILRGLAATLTRAVVVAAEAPGAMWPARPHLTSEQAAPAGTPDRSH